jgi:hypothetical protein
MGGREGGGSREGGGRERGGRQRGCHGVGIRKGKRRGKKIGVRWGGGR